MWSHTWGPLHYLVSEIGERLTSVKREEIERDDLPEMVALFKIFSGAKTATKAILEKASGRCKIQDIERFKNESHWVIDRWWTREERIAIGADDAVEAATRGDVDEQSAKLSAVLSDFDKFVSADPLAGHPTKDIALGDESAFRMFIGKRVLRKDVTKDGKIPAYSANVFTPMGFIEEGNISDFSHATLLWGIDGNFEFNIIPNGQEFATTDHCGAIQVLNPQIVSEYVLWALHDRRVHEDFDRSFRASLTNMRKFVIRIPVTQSGQFDVVLQKEIAKRFGEVKKKRASVLAAKSELDNLLERYLAAIL